MTTPRQENTNLATRISQRLRSAALVVVVRDSDETRAVAEATAAAELFPPVRVLSGTNPEIIPQLEELASSSGKGTIIALGVCEARDGDAFANRAIREVALQKRDSGKEFSRLILIEQPHVKIPQGIVGDSEILDPVLPTVAQLREELDSFVEANNIIVPGNGEMRFALSTAVAGLPRHEANRLFARSYVEREGMDPVWIRAEKALRVTSRLGGALTFESSEGPDVGGADLLQKWLSSRKAAFESQKAIDWGLPRPKGVLLLGVPGGGKSLSARLVARMYGVPLLRLDAGKLFGSLVGQSESQTRLMIETATACAPCVVWIDEIEKGFGGSGGLDGGTSTRVLGTLLTWLQEDQSQVFKIATANKISSLPPEMLRKGRFDEIFFVDLPTEKEREIIFKIHLDRRKRYMELEQIAVLAKEAKDFTGAEIEQAIIEGLFTAYNDGPRDLSFQDVSSSIAATVPLARTMPDEIKAIREFAATRCRPASSEKNTAVPTPVSGVITVNRPRIG